MPIEPYFAIMNIKSLAVFCGSKTGANPSYAADATTLGCILAKHGIEMIYGGGRNGLMGCVADCIMQQGGTVRGVIPQVLIEWESQHLNISELLVVDDMHLRKKKMYALCDAAIILPGGFGTLDELFEILTWNQLSLHDKKIFLLNTAGFYDHLIEHLQLLKREGFLYNNLEQQLTVLQDAASFEKMITG